MRALNTWLSGVIKASAGKNASSTADISLGRFTSRIWGPTMLMATSRILATAHQVTNPVSYDREGSRPSGILGRNERFGWQECHLETVDASLGLSSPDRTNGSAGENAPLKVANISLCLSAR